MLIQLSVATSADGYIDDCSRERLVLSHPDDWAEVYRLRAEFDAILVGAETVRRDNPSLRLKDNALQQLRIGQGKSPEPTKIVLSRSGNLDPDSRFFTTGSGEKTVIVESGADPQRIASLQNVASIYVVEPPITVRSVTDILSKKGIKSLFVEGGSRTLTFFLKNGEADLLRVAVAPFFVGESQAPRMTCGSTGGFRFDKSRRMHVLQVRQVGDMSVTDYALTQSGIDYFRLRQAIAEASKCPKSDTAYSVGAVIVAANGKVFTGFSRETAPNNHAEEEAILKAEKAAVSLQDAVMYSSMEPCSTRKSKPLSCSELIIRHKMKRVVFAAYEPDRFVQCCGANRLQKAGIDVLVLSDLSAEALAPNAHILSR